MARPTTTLLGTIYHNKARKNYRFRYGRQGTPMFFKTKTEAVAYQKEFTQKIKTEGTQAVTTLKASHEAKSAFKLLADHKLPASALVDAVRLYIAHTNLESRGMTFTDALKEVYKTSRFLKLAKGTRADYTTRWNKLESFIGNDVLLTEVSAALLKKFLDRECKGNDSKAFKFYSSIKVLIQSYFMGVTRVMKNNPLKEMKDPPTKPDSKRKAIYSKAEVFQLLKHARSSPECPVMDQKLDLALHISFFTGLRASELTQITPRDFFKGESIDWNNSPFVLISAAVAKEGTEKRVYLPPSLVFYLKSNHWFRTLSADDRVFPHTVRTYRQALHPLCKIAGVPYKELAASRNTFATHAIDGLFNSSVEATARQLGHSTSTTSLQHYVNSASHEDCSTYFELYLTDELKAEAKKTNARFVNKSR